MSIEIKAKATAANDLEAVDLEAVDLEAVDLAQTIAAMWDSTNLDPMIMRQYRQKV